MMKSSKLLTMFEIICTIFGVFAIALLLAAALYIQFVYNEAPCPLCLLQRAAFISIGIALLMNLRDRSNLHWVVVIISALAGIAASIRQILLHITDSTGFASTVFGLHMYTWSFIAFTLTIVGSSLLLLLRNWQNSSQL